MPKSLIETLCDGDQPNSTVRTELTIGDVLSAYQDHERRMQLASKSDAEPNTSAAQ